MKKQLFITALAAVTLLSSCGESHVSTPWGKEIDNYIYQNFAKATLPYVESNSFEYQFVTDDFGDPLLCLYCFYDTDENAEAASLEYYATCARAGYTMDSGYNWGYDATTYEYYEYYTNFADIVVGKNLGMEIQFLTSTYKSKPCLGIFAYTYIYEDKNVYPAVAVEHYLGKERAAKVPKVIGEGYEYAFYFQVDYYGDTYLEIRVSGGDYELEEEYFNACLENSFYLTDSFQDEVLEEYPGVAVYDYYYAIDPSMEFAMAFYYDFTGQYLDIQIFLA